MEKIGEYTLPFKLGLDSGHNGCNVYDANDNQVCSLGLLLHQTIREIREFAKTSPRIEKELEFADYLINAINSHAALLAACKEQIYCLKLALHDNPEIFKLFNYGIIKRGESVIEQAGEEK